MTKAKPHLYWSPNKWKAYLKEQEELMAAKQQAKKEKGQEKPQEESKP